jgi:hypothetical protein
VTEHLHAPYVDLVELDGCVVRIGQCIRLMESAPPPSLTSVSTTGVAPISALTMVPGLPLLHHRAILAGAVGTMGATVDWTLGTSEERKKAVVTLRASCQPLMGNVEIQEDVRLDLSNAPGPGDADARTRILDSLRRLQSLVRHNADAMRRAMSGGDPKKTVEEGCRVLETMATPFASVAIEETDEEDDVEDLLLMTGAPYRRAVITFKEQRHSQYEHLLLSDPAAEALDSALPGLIEMEIKHHFGGVRYSFGATKVTLEADDRTTDPIMRLRRHQEMSQVPVPAWRGHGHSVGESYED